MQDVTTFILNHWMLSGAFAVVAILIMANELMGRLTGGKKCTVPALTQLLNNQEGQVLDIRQKDDFKMGHIVGAVNIPEKELADKWQRLESCKQKPVIVVDAMGQKSHAATTLLCKQGFEQVYFLGGGLAAWKQENFPLVKK